MWTGLKPLREGRQQRAYIELFLPSLIEFPYLLTYLLPDIFTIENLSIEYYHCHMKVLRDFCEEVRDKIYFGRDSGVGTQWANSGTVKANPGRLGWHLAALNVLDAAAHVQVLSTINYKV